MFRGGKPIDHILLVEVNGDLPSANNVDTSKDEVSAEETSQEMYRQKRTL